MKYLIIPCLAILCCGCHEERKASVSKSAKGFAYVLPLMVERATWNLIVDRKLETAPLFMKLSEKDTVYELSIILCQNLSNEYFGFLKVASSNRKILINDRLYSVVFESDRKFGSLLNSITSLEQRELQYKTGGYTIRRGPYQINDNAFRILFNTNGEIVK